MTPPRLLSISLVAKGTSRHDRSVLPSILDYVPSALPERCQAAKLPCRHGRYCSSRAASLNDDASVQSAWRNLDLAAGEPERCIRGGVPTRPDSLEASLLLCQPINISRTSREHAKGFAPSRNSRGCWGLEGAWPICRRYDGRIRSSQNTEPAMSCNPVRHGGGSWQSCPGWLPGREGCQHAAGSVPRARTMACSGLPCNRPTAADSLRWCPLQSGCWVIGRLAFNRVVVFEFWSRSWSMDHPSASVSN